MRLTKKNPRQVALTSRYCRIFRAPAAQVKVLQMYIMQCRIFRAQTTQSKFYKCLFTVTDVIQCRFSGIRPPKPSSIQRFSWLVVMQCRIFRAQTTQSKLTVEPYHNRIQTVEHILQHCPLFHLLRTLIWPYPTPIHTKLFGSLRKLRKTARFINASGLNI